MRKKSSHKRRWHQRKSWQEFRASLTERQFCHYFRMSRECFDLLCTKIESNVGEGIFKSEAYIFELQYALAPSNSMAVMRMRNLVKMRMRNLVRRLLVVQVPIGIGQIITCMMIIRAVLILINHLQRWIQHPPKVNLSSHCCLLFFSSRTLPYPHQTLSALYPVRA